ncbi:GGDEF domain-containing protein [Desulfatiferula olefinivorans]
MAAAFSLAVFSIVAADHLRLSPAMYQVLEGFSYLPYTVMVGGVFTARRFNNTGLVLTAFALILVYLSVQTHGAPIYDRPVASPAVGKAALFLFPVNLIGFSFLIKRRIFSSLGSLYLFLFGLEILAVGIFCNPYGLLAVQSRIVLAGYSQALSDGVFALSLSLTRFLNDLGRLSGVLVLLWALVFLFVRYVYLRDMGLAAFSMILATAMAGLLTAHSPAGTGILFFASGSLVIIAAIEGSYAMNDKDSLTGLDARKRLGARLRTLKGHYALALVDLDQFGRFNDDFGPDAGDAALKIIGDKLADLFRGVRAFRYGGEEFLVVFPEPQAAEAEILLETFRRTIESFPFLVPVTRMGLAIGGPKKQDRVRSAPLTVSVGAAFGSPTKKPQDVLACADKALERAKREGRNRVAFWPDAS